MSETDDAVARRALSDVLGKFNCRVHQPDDPPLFSKEPKSSMRSTLWRWSDLEPLLTRLGSEVGLKAGGSRRTLRLSSPGLESGTTPTFWASIQVILPGEVATAHRHSANAFRFVMRGSGAFTTVDGERYPMSQGDLVLTPSMAWHDHVHEGDEPMVWLDVLDIPLMRSLHASFFEGSTVPVQPLAQYSDRSYREFGSGLFAPPDMAVRDAHNPLLVYPAARAAEAVELARGLPPNRVDDIALDYRNPITGGAVMRTMGMRQLLLRPGFHGAARRATASQLYFVIEGEGSTFIDGEEFRWSAGDLVAVKPWAWCRHVNAAPFDARLFQVNDAPALRALGFFRVEEDAGEVRP